MTEAYPLHWPLGWPRTKYPSRARFLTSAGVARDAIVWELGKMGSDIIISSNVPLRLDGLPYAARSEPDDKGVAVYFKKGGQNLCIPCDRWDRGRDNLQAIHLTIQALRGLERWGAKSMVDAAFTGFQALPAPGTTARPWWMVLDVDPKSERVEIESAYRELAKQHHPDAGGDADEFNEIGKAIRQARREFGA